MTTNFNLTVQTKNKKLKIIFNKINQPNTSLKIILALHLILHILDICIDNTVHHHIYSIFYIIKSRICTLLFIQSIYYK